MRATFIIALSLIAAPAAAAAVPPADVAGAERFIDQLYARYRAPVSISIGEPAQWRLDAVFTPDLVALFDRSAALAPPDEVPEFGDGDHICQCQDWENLRLIERQVHITGPGRAEAEVRFENVGAAKRVRMILALTPAGWRVADLAYDLYPNGLAGALRASVAATEGARAAPH